MFNTLQAAYPVKEFTHLEASTLPSIEILWLKKKL
jgi:hypothetical protein